MAGMKHVTRSWLEAEEVYRRFARKPRHGGKPRVNLGYATWLNQYLPDDVDSRAAEYAVRFHATDVVTYHADGEISVRTDGWYTKTTRERIDLFTPDGVFVDADGIFRPPPTRFALGVTLPGGVEWHDLIGATSVRFIPSPVDTEGERA